MSQDIKAKNGFLPHHMIFSLSRALRVMGWFIFCLTLGYTAPRSISIYNSASMALRSWRYERPFEYAVSQTVSMLFIGISVAACAFLLSAALYTGLHLLSQRRTQIALLERLVRERHEKLSAEQAIILIENL